MLEKMLSLLGFLVAIAAVIWLVLIDHLIATNPILLGIQSCAALLMFWARKTFGLRSFHATANTTEGGLVTTGPYRYWRHPIYASLIYFVWAGQVQAPSALPVALAIAATLGLVARMVLEERFLAVAYPEYSQYARRTKRLVPFLI